jgi:hypothetical protein
MNISVRLYVSFLSLKNFLSRFMLVILDSRCFSIPNFQILHFEEFHEQFQQLRQHEMPKNKTSYLMDVRDVVLGLRLRNLSVSCTLTVGLFH